MPVGADLAAPVSAAAVAVRERSAETEARIGVDPGHGPVIKPVRVIEPANRIHVGPSRVRLAYAALLPGLERSAKSADAA